MSARGPVARRSLRIGLSALSAATALAAGELFARSCAPSPAPPVRLAQFAEVVEEQHHVAFREVFVSDHELFWRLAPDVRLPDDSFPLFGRISNARGLREEHELASKKTGEVRLLFAGDSCTFGYRLAREKALPELCERLLASRFPETNIQCINSGVPGYSLFQTWRFLETEGWSYEPDLVVLQSGWNESAPWDGLGDIEHHARSRARLPPSGLRWSRLAGILWATLHKDETDSPSPEIPRRPRLSVEEFRALLEDIRASADSRGIALLPFVAACRANLDPSRIRTPYQEALAEFAPRLAAPGRTLPALFDAVPVLRRMAREHETSELFFDGIHPTVLANERMSELLVQELLPWLEERTN